MPRSVLRPPAARVVASRAMITLCRLLEGGFTALKALSRRPYALPTAHVRRLATWAVGVFISVMERMESAWTAKRKIGTPRLSSGWTQSDA